MSQALTKNRDYLGEHRRMIIGRSLATATAGALPIPMLDDWLSSTLARGTMKRIAESRSVDATDEALRAVADGSESPPGFADLLGGGLALKLLARQWRKLVFAVMAARRARAAAKAFTVATLFDHYCARLHVGLGLDDESGRRIRKLIDRAMDETPGGLSHHLFRRGVIAGARSAARAPLELADAATGGWVQRVLSRRSEALAAQDVDEALEQQLSAEDGFLARAVAAIELRLTTDDNPYLESVLDRFEMLWREQESDDE